MSGVNVTFVGLVTPEAAGLTVQTIGMRILRGETSGIEPDGTYWECDGVTDDADEEDDDDTIPA
jgi:hypothetical protein